MKNFKHSLQIVFCTIAFITFASCNSSDSPKNVTTKPAGNSTPVPYPGFKGTEVRGEKNFAVLINSYARGKIEPTPWAGYWWPYTSNGIAAGNFFTNESPAGRYDAARGGATAAQLWEIRHHGASVPKLQAWWGHCNGWCAAAALFREPNESVTVNGIPFGIGDIKALLSEAGMSVNADFFGERLDVDDPNSPKYWDTVPDQYFLVLTNYIGKLKQAVLIDRYTGSQIWNQPLAGYQFEYPQPSDYLGNSAEAPNIYRIELTSTLWWLDDGVAPDVQTHPFNFEEEDPTGMVQSRTLRMEVWLDGPVEFDQSGKIKSSGNVIVAREGDFIAGGAWKMGEGMLMDAWPDYMWVPYTIVKPTDPEQDYANPEVDIDWIKTHLLVPGGSDDPSVRPGTVQPAPPVHNGNNGSNSPWPTYSPGPVLNAPTMPDRPSTPTNPSSGGAGSFFPNNPNPTSGGSFYPNNPYPSSGGSSYPNNSYPSPSTWGSFFPPNSGFPGSSGFPGTPGNSGFPGGPWFSNNPRPIHATY